MVGHHDEGVEQHRVFFDRFAEDPEHDVVELLRWQKQEAIVDGLAGDLVGGAGFYVAEWSGHAPTTSNGCAICWPCGFGRLRGVDGPLSGCRSGPGRITDLACRWLGGWHLSVASPTEEKRSQGQEPE